MSVLVRCTECGWQRRAQELGYAQRIADQHEARSCFVPALANRVSLDRAKLLYPSCNGLTEQQWVDGWNIRLDFLAAMVFNPRIPIRLSAVSRLTLADKRNEIDLRERQAV